MMQASIGDTLQFHPSLLSVHALDLYLSTGTVVFFQTTWLERRSSLIPALRRTSVTPPALQHQGVITSFGPFRKILTIALDVYARGLEETHIKPFYSDSVGSSALSALSALSAQDLL